ncbi:MAG: hypothetical protein JNM43_22005 [Planctomycetaceae bacterium]|nr:hypothetical protein [Planctomycetaceae bacterium]
MSSKRARFKCDGKMIDVLEGAYLSRGKPTPEAREFAASILAMVDKIRKFASRKLRSRHNDAWRDDDAPIINESQFCELLGQPKIVLYDEEGSASIYFSPKSLFDGHGVEVALADGKPYHATVIG